jgi:5-methylcytosine-specific restriction endonuclease McrA
MDNKTYLRTLRDKRRVFCFGLLGGKCVTCGSVKNLNFDHKDPSTKKYNISEILAGKLEKLLVEVKKCQLLCNKCHKIKSVKESIERNFGKGKHGTMWRYWKHKCRCDVCRAYKHQQYLKYG